MKKFVLIAITIASTSLALVSCKKDCSQNSACTDTVPTDEVCLAHFTRWFYNSESNTCEQIAYSGCNQVGFATQEECEACDCE